MFTTGPARIFESDEELESYLNRVDEIKWGRLSPLPLPSQEVGQDQDRSAHYRQEGRDAPGRATNPYPDFTNARRWWAEGYKESH